MVSTGVLTVIYCGVLWKPKYLLNRFLVEDHNLEIRVRGPLRFTPIDGSLSSKSVKQIFCSPRHNTIDTCTSQYARRHHACLAHDVNLHTIIKAENVLLWGKIRLPFNL